MNLFEFYPLTHACWPMFISWKNQHCLLTMLLPQTRCICNNNCIGGFHPEWDNCHKLVCSKINNNHHNNKSELSVFFYLLFVYLAANFRTLCREQPHSSNVNHYVLFMFDPQVTSSLVTTLDLYTKLSAKCGFNREIYFICKCIT